MGIELYTAIVNGAFVPLHRCTECNRAIANATGRPTDDNGFVPVGKPIRHVAGCDLAPREVRPARRKA